MRNPYFGQHGNPDTRGDTARRRHRMYVGVEPTDSPRRENGCDRCRCRVWWDTDSRGRMVPLDMQGRVHLCEPTAVLAALVNRDGETILAQLRQTLNERRAYGAAV